MKFLIDKSPACVQQKVKSSDLVIGQFCTPLTRYNNWGGDFAVDNGAYTRFDLVRFVACLRKHHEHKSKCLFVTVPDVVGSGRRTLELWRRRDKFVKPGWPLAFVAQDGVEDLDIPWCEMDCLFLGGRDPWKESQASRDIVRTAVTLGIRTHIGRVNTHKRYKLFCELGANTCDGSGVAMYDHMLEAIERAINKPEDPTLFD